jgi:O-antigen/teichoic acid export membrane protein
MSVDTSEQLTREAIPTRLSLAAVAARAAYLKSRFPSASQGLFSIFDQAIVSATSFATAAIIGRTTSPGELGLYYLVLSIVVVLSGVQDQLVLSPYAVYSKRRDGRDLSEYAGSIWAHQFALTALIVIGALAAIAACTATGNTRHLPGLWALVGAGPLLMLRDSIRRFTFANLHVKSAIALDAIVAIVQLGGLAALAYFDSLTLLRIYAVMGAACGLACVIWFSIDRTHIHIVRERIVPDWCHNWSFGKWALRSFLVGNTTAPAMLWILDVAVGTAATGLLGACTTIVGLTNVIMSGVSNVLTPQAAQAFTSGGAAELKRVLAHTAAFFTVSLGAFALFVLATSDFLAVIVFGDSFQGSGPILFALALSALMNSLGMVAGNGLWAINQPRFNFIADVGSMAATLLTAAILIVPLGALGAALATLAGTTVAAVVRTIIFLRQVDNASPSQESPSLIGRG